MIPTRALPFFKNLVFLFVLPVVTFTSIQNSFGDESYYIYLKPDSTSGVSHAGVAWSDAGNGHGQSEVVSMNNIFDNNRYYLDIPLMKPSEGMNILKHNLSNLALVVVTCDSPAPRIEEMNAVLFQSGCRVSSLVPRGQ